MIRSRDRNWIRFLFVLLICANMLFYRDRVGPIYRSISPPIEPNREKRHVDLYPSWYAARELLLHHRDPYGVEVNRELEFAYYGNEFDPFHPDKPRDRQRFVYPLYFLLMVAPIAAIDFSTARVVAWWVLTACAVGSVFFWLRFVRLRLSRFNLAILLMLILTSVPMAHNLNLLQPFLLPAFLIAGAAAALVSEHLFLAGALLAAATVKPQICALPLAWFGLWLGSDWKHRRSLLAGFGATLTVLLLVSEWLVPGWLARYPSVLRDYAQYTGTTSFLGALLPAPWHWPITLLVLTVVISYCWRVRRQPADSPEFAIATSLVLTLTNLVIPAVVPPLNDILLLPAVLLVIRYWEQLWQGNTLRRAAALLFCFCALLPWLVALVSVTESLNRDPNWIFVKTWPILVASTMTLRLASFAILMLLSRVAAPHSANATI